jgi:hypothetical protein
MSKAGFFSANFWEFTPSKSIFVRFLGFSDRFNYGKKMIVETKDDK